MKTGDLSNKEDSFLQPKENQGRRRNMNAQSNQERKRKAIKEPDMSELKTKQPEATGPRRSAGELSFTIGA